MKYRTFKAGEWLKPVMRKFKFCCCDCGLVHNFDFQVIRWGRGHKVKMRVFRNERATNAVRRRKGEQ